MIKESWYKSCNNKVEKKYYRTLLGIHVCIILQNLTVYARPTHGDLKKA